MNKKQDHYDGIFQFTFVTLVLQNYCNTTGIKNSQIKKFLTFQIFHFQKNFQKKNSQSFFVQKNFQNISGSQQSQNISTLPTNSLVILPANTPSRNPIFQDLAHSQSGPCTGSDVLLFLNGALHGPGLGSTDPLFDRKLLEVSHEEGVRSLFPSEAHFTDEDSLFSGPIGDL
ncbi:MAG: hypothetical protein ABFC78_01920 [Methanoregula sp.]